MQYDTLAQKNVVSKTIASLVANGISAEVVDTPANALLTIKKYIPKGVSVMNGSSVTLQQIGFVEYLKSGTHGWNDLHAPILAEKDPAEQGMLRQKAIFSEYYIGSAHAVTENGEIIIASASGSQLPHLVFTSSQIILVVGTQKIVPTLDEAMTRLATYVFPREDARAKEVGYGGSVLSKILILKNEPKMMGRNFRVLFVNQILGF